MVLGAFLAGCAAGCGLMAYGQTGTWWGVAAGAWGFAAGVEFAAAWRGAREGEESDG